MPSPAITRHHLFEYSGLFWFLIIIPVIVIELPSRCSFCCHSEKIRRKYSTLLTG